ncbi:MAG: hypothetical protein EHM24_30995 [Acidobacteria bacterium]|nr:MAG: hypothetical protein EHM24_30995 [Acidobacteriota bacterium]
MANRHIDLDALLAIAERQPEGWRHTSREVWGQASARPSPSIGYLRDSAFNFYYPDNLEALEAAGAVLVPISSLAREPLPPGLGALYVGGGFPETHASALSANRVLLDSLRYAAERGLPIYAECGGLMLLADAIRWRGERHAMAGVLPVDVEVLDRPQGHGYTTLAVDRDNAFFPLGTVLRGHEFHYSRLVESPATREARRRTACAVERGTGCGEGRDAVIVGNVWAGYTHLHALGSPEWAVGMVRAARRYLAGCQLISTKTDA